MSDLEELIKGNVLREDPSEDRLWLVGSLDGSLKTLEDVILNIESSGTLCSNDKIIFMGNFIGETFHNKEIIKLLRDYQKARPTQVYVMKGPREQMFTLSRLSFFSTSLGSSIKANYPKSKYLSPSKDFDLKTFYEDRLWLETLPSIIETKNHFIVHKAVTVTKSLSNQDPLSTMFMESKTFLNTKLNYPKKVVFSSSIKRIVATDKVGIENGCVLILNDTKKDKPLLSL